MFEDRIDPLDMLPSPGVFVEQLPQIKLDATKKEMFVGEIKIGLIKSLKMDDSLIIVEKYRVYVPQFQFENPWENFIGSDIPSDDEAVEDYDKQRSHVFLDKRTRKPLLYTFAIDKDNNLFFVSKRIEQ